MKKLIGVYFTSQYAILLPEKTWRDKVKEQNYYSTFQLHLLMDKEVAI